MQLLITPCMGFLITQQSLSIVFYSVAVQASSFGAGARQIFQGVRILRGQKVINFDHFFLASLFFKLGDERPKFQQENVPLPPPPLYWHFQNTAYKFVSYHI